jgi:hypothetical protein
MATEQHIEYLSNFEKVYDLKLPMAFRAGAEGSPVDTRHAILLDNQPIMIYNINSGTKREIKKEEILNFKMNELLDTLVTNVYWNMRYQEANLKNESYQGPNEVTMLEVSAKNIAALNTVYERYADHKNGKDIKMIASKKQARAGFDEPVKNNIGLLTFMEDGVKRGSMYIIDVVLEKDSSGGYNLLNRERK